MPIGSPGQLSGQNARPRQLADQRDFGEPIRATLLGDNVCEAEDQTARGPTPVLALCRKLVEARFDPGRPLHAYRGEVLCLIVRSIGKGAGLTVDEHNGTRFAKWKPFFRSAVSSRIAPAKRRASTLAQPPAALCPMPHVCHATVSGPLPTVETIGRINSEHPTEKLNTLNRHG